MTHDELLWAINSVVESGPCETVGHYSSAKALRAVVALHKPFLYPEDDKIYCEECNVKYPCPTIQDIEKEVR